MPFIHIRLAGAAPTQDRLAALSQEIVAITAHHLRKQAALTAVLIEPLVAAGLWTVGDSAPPTAAHLEIAVTAGTNTAAEKAAFIAAATDALRRAAGPDLPLASYVVVREIAADSWGYDGRTQADRQAASKAPA